MEGGCDEVEDEDIAGCLTRVDGKCGCLSASVDYSGC